jgi:hypothetical protein
MEARTSRRRERAAGRRAGRAVPPAREQADMVLVRVESIFVSSRVHIGSVRPRAASGAALCPPGRRAP